MPTAEMTELDRAVDELESLAKRVKKARRDVEELQMFLYGDEYEDALDELRVRIAAGETATVDEPVVAGETPLTIAEYLAYDRGRFEAELHALTGLLDRWDEHERGVMTDDAARRLEAGKEGDDA